MSEKQLCRTRESCTTLLHVWHGPKLLNKTSHRLLIKVKMWKRQQSDSHQAELWSFVHRLNHACPGEELCRLDSCHRGSHLSKLENTTNQHHITSPLNKPTCRQILFFQRTVAFETHGAIHDSAEQFLCTMCLKLPRMPGNVHCCDRGFLFWSDGLMPFSSKRYSIPTTYKTSSHPSPSPVF